MSRVAKNPVALPKGVEVSLAGGNVTVKGPLGSLTLNRNPAVEHRPGWPAVRGWYPTVRLHFLHPLLA